MFCIDEFSVTYINVLGVCNDIFVLVVHKYNVVLLHPWHSAEFLQLDHRDKSLLPRLNFDVGFI